MRVTSKHVNDFEKLSRKSHWLSGQLLIVCKDVVNIDFAQHELEKTDVKM